MEWRPAGWSVCLPLLISPCTIKSRSSLLAPAHPGGPGKRAIKRLWCGVVCVLVHFFWLVNVCFCCVRLCFFDIISQEIGLGNVTNWPILCRMGHKSLTQSINHYWAAGALTPVLIFQNLVNFSMVHYLRIAQISWKSTHHFLCHLLANKNHASRHYAYQLDDRGSYHIHTLRC